MADQILIRGLRLSCHIGVPEEERANPQELRAHLTLTVPEFPNHDDLEATIDYKKVSDFVREHTAAKERQLIETLAQDIARFVLTEFAVQHIRVELEKFILPETDWVGVIIERSSSQIN